MSKIVIKCPSCAKLNSVAREHINKHARCGACQTVFLVSEDSSEAKSSTSKSASRPSSSSVQSPSAPGPIRPTAATGSGGPKASTSSPHASAPGTSPGASQRPSSQGKPDRFRPVPNSTSTAAPAPAPNPFANEAPKPLPQISTGVSTGLATTNQPAYGYGQCPYCRVQAGVYTRSEISTAGWIVFAVMIISCWPLFWIGLLIKEDKVHCGSCHARLS